MSDISVVISAFNEENNLKECLASLKNLRAEIIVIDNSSIDKTATIAKEYTKHVYTQKNDPLKIDLQKNFGFLKATNPWVLSVDADERLTPELIEEIKEKLETDDESTQGYLIPRKNIIFGKWIKHALWSPDYQLRLFRKGKGKFTSASVHEPLQVEGKTEVLEQPMTHINYTSISQYLTKMMTIYTEVEAKKIFDAGKKVTWADAIRFPVQDFLKNFFLLKGYLDGLHGLTLCLLQAFYMEIVFAKVWELQGFPEYNNDHFLHEFINESKRLTKETKYWETTSLSDEEQNPVKKAVLRGKRKLQQL